MIKAVLAIIFITTFFILYRSGKNNYRIKELQDELVTVNKTLEEKNTQIEKSLNSTLNAILTSQTKNNGVYRKKHIITINSNTREVTTKLPYTLKNVESIELISGIIPKSSYKINNFRNSLEVNGNTYSIQYGSYTDIITFLIELNQQLYEEPNENVIFMFNNLSKKVIALSNTAVNQNTFNFDVDNSIASTLGFGEKQYTFISTPATQESNAIAQGSLTYFTKILNEPDINIKTVNNKPVSRYNFTSTSNIYTPTPIDGSKIIVNPDWSYIESENRVNMKHQLYVDVLIDQVQYWDGTHRLARIFVKESEEEVEYTSYGNPIRRPLAKKLINLDKITCKLNAVISDKVSYPYELNGINYSLQLEIVTLEPLLEG